jgi:hypothetical protein
LLAGVVVLELAALVPVVGWFAVTTLALLTGAGAVIIALFQRAPRPAPAPEEMPESSLEWSQ